MSDGETQPIVMPAHAGIQQTPTFVDANHGDYWIARIIKLVPGPAKPDPGAGQ